MDVKFEEVKERIRESDGAVDGAGVEVWKSKWVR